MACGQVIVCARPFGYRLLPFLYQSRPKLFRPLIPSSAHGIDGGPRRFTEVVLNEQSLPVASMKSSRSQDATSATQAKTSLAAMAAVATRALMAG